MKNPVPKKPVWDTSIDGVHPALRTSVATEEEIEHFKAMMRANRELIDSHGRSMMTSASKDLALLQTHADFHLQNIEHFLRLKQTDQVRYHRAEAARALYKLGRFADALKAITNAKGKSLPGFAAQVRHIISIHEAVERDDNEACNCKRKVVETVDHNDKPVTLTLNRRSVSEEIYSLRHRQSVPVLKCRHCGHLNATPHAPARQTHHERLRHQARHGANDARLYSDHALLKDE